MFQLTVLHNQPTDPELFDDYYFGTHIPLAQKLPGLRRFTVIKPQDTDGEKAQYYVVAVLEWDDEAAYTMSLESTEGQAALDDLPFFAGAGLTFLPGEVTTFH